MKIISVIGCGTMGNGIAQTFALFDFNVKLYDISLSNLDNAKKTIQKNLERMVNKEVINHSDLQKTCNNITYTNDVNSVLNSDLVIEAVTENLEIKESIFKELDAKCPEKTIIASNTSSISITKLANVTKRKDKVIGMHFMNPVPIMKLVEVINSKHTSLETTNTILDLSKKLNKIPLSVNDYPGFISNRILMPMINEAIEALDQGVANVKNIDGIMKLGMNHPIGPLALSDLIGNDTVLHIMNVLHEGLKHDKYAPAPLLIDMVEQGKLGRKSGQGFYDYS